MYTPHRKRTREQGTATGGEEHRHKAYAFTFLDFLGTAVASAARAAALTLRRLKLRVVAAAAQSRLCERKVLLLGEDCVGKTTLAQRARGSIRSATTTTTTTIGIDVASATVATPHGPVKLRIWDTTAFTYLVNCGSREALGALLRGSAVVVLVFDVTRRASFEALKHIVAAVVDADGSEPPHGRRFLVVANKTEAPGREVSAEEAQRFAASLGDARSVEISAKTGTGVQQWLQLVAE